MAHLARDTAFALEHGSDDLPLRLKLWFGRAFDLADGVAELTAATLARKKRELEKQLSLLLAAVTHCDLARDLQAKIARTQNPLLTFCYFLDEVEATNNASERKLRPLRDPAKSHQRPPRYVGGSYQFLKIATHAAWNESQRERFRWRTEDDRHGRSPQASQ